MLAEKWPKIRGLREQSYISVARKTYETFLEGFWESYSFLCYCTCTKYRNNDMCYWSLISFLCITYVCYNAIQGNTYVFWQKIQLHSVIDQLFYVLSTYNKVLVHDYFGQCWTEDHIPCLFKNLKKKNKNSNKKYNTYMLNLLGTL